MVTSQDVIAYLKAIDCVNFNAVEVTTKVLQGLLRLHSNCQRARGFDVGKCLHKHDKGRLRQFDAVGYLMAPSKEKHLLRCRQRCTPTIVSLFVDGVTQRFTAFDDLSSALNHSRKPWIRSAACSQFDRLVEIVAFAS